jgi:hypothetical protein
MENKFQSMTFAEKAKTRAHMRKNGIDPAELTAKQFVDYAKRHGFLDGDNRIPQQEDGDKQLDDLGKGDHNMEVGGDDGDTEEQGGGNDGDGEDDADDMGDDDIDLDDLDGDDAERPNDAPEKPEAQNPMDEHMLNLIAQAIAHHNHVDDHYLPAEFKRYVKRAVKLAVSKLPKPENNGGPRLLDKQELLEQNKVQFDYTHAMLDNCAKLIKRRKNVYLCGPAGSGKTTMGKQLAELFSVDFVYLGRVDDAFQLSGYVNAHGDFVETPFFDAFVNGKMIMLDEMDRWAAEALTWANAALANGYATFGDGKTYTKHDNCIVLAAGNTYGTGHDNIYTAAQALDGATMDRFMKVEIGYDEKLERKLALDVNPDAGPWVDFVQKCRKRAVKAGMDVIVSPRASIDGADLLQEGFSFDDLKAMTFMAGLSATDVATLEG